jgi:hypothetical protein
MDGRARTPAIGWKRFQRSPLKCKRFSDEIMRHFFSSRRDRTQYLISLLQIARSCVPELARFRIKFSVFFLVTFQSP